MLKPYGGRALSGRRKRSAVATVRAMIPPFESAPNNCLLASLPPEVTERLRSRIMSVDLQAGEMLYEAGAFLRHVYFPVTAVV